MEDMGNDPARESGALRPPAAQRPRQHADARRPTTSTRRATTRSSTSTRSSTTTTTASSTTCRSRSCPATSRSARRRRTSASSRPNLCHDGHDEPCANGEPGGLVSADAWLREWVPRITALAGVQARRPAARDLRRGRGRGRHRRRERLLQPGAVPEHAQQRRPDAGQRRRARRRGRALAVHPAGDRHRATPYNHFSTLRTVEELFGLPLLGYAGIAGPGQLRRGRLHRPLVAPPTGVVESVPSARASRAGAEDRGSSASRLPGSGWPPTSRSRTAGGGSPVCLAGGHGCATVAKSADYFHLAGINVAVFGIVGYVLILAAALTPGDLGRFGGFLAYCHWLRLQRLPHLPRTLRHRRHLPLVRSERGPDGASPGRQWRPELSRTPERNSRRAVETEDGDRAALGLGHAFLQVSVDGDPDRHRRQRLREAAIGPRGRELKRRRDGGGWSNTEALPPSWPSASSLSSSSSANPAAARREAAPRTPHWSSNSLVAFPTRAQVLGDPKAKVTVIEYADLQCPVCQDVLDRDRTRPHFAGGPQEHRDVRPPPIHDHRPGFRRRRKGRTGHRRAEQLLELRGALLPEPGHENSGYVTDDFLHQRRQRGRSPSISTSGTRTARARSRTPALSKVQSETQSLGINSTPTFVVQGPGGKKVVGSGVLPLSQLPERDQVGRVAE